MENENDKEKRSFTSIATIFAIVMLIAITVAYGMIYMKPKRIEVSNEKVVAEKTEENIATATETEIDSEMEKKNQEEIVVKVSPIIDETPYHNVKPEIKESSIKTKELAKQFDKKPNIKGEEIVDEMATSGTDDTVLTNKNDRLSYKEQDKKNVNQSNSGTANTPDEMVIDNTPSYEAEPEQKNDITWEDGGEPMKKEEQQVSDGVSSGVSTNGGYLN